MPNIRKLRIQWEKFPNQNIREMHTDERLNCRYWGHDDYDGLPNEDSDRFKELSSEQQELLRALYGIHGVKQIGLDAYSVRVTKADVFDWEEIQPRIEAVFSEWVGSAAVRHGDVIDHYSKWERHRDY